MRAEAEMIVKLVSPRKVGIRREEHCDENTASRYTVESNHELAPLVQRNIPMFSATGRKNADSFLLILTTKGETNHASDQDDAGRN